MTREVGEIKMSAIAILRWLKEKRTDEGHVIKATETEITLRVRAYYEDSDWEDLCLERGEDGCWYELNKPDAPIEIRLVEMGDDKWLVRWRQGNGENCHCHRRVEEMVSDDYYDFLGAFRTYKELKTRKATNPRADISKIEIRRYQEVDLSSLEPEINKVTKVKKDAIAEKERKRAEAERIRIEAREKEQLVRLREKYPNGDANHANDGK